MDDTLDNRLEQARAGNSTAWRELVGEHLGAVYAICRAFGLDSTAAGEVNQAVWLRLAENLSRIRTPAAVGGWIAATARRECVDPTRDAGRSGWIVGGLSLQLDDGAEAAHVADCVSLGRSFARLGAFAQRLLRLSAVRPKPSDEVVAAALDVAVPVVPVVQRRALERLERLTHLDALAEPPEDVERSLAQVLAYGDPVPAGWWSAAEAAFGWLCIDAELADVVYDSSFSAERERLERAPGAEAAGLARRSLRFSTGPRQVDVIIDIANGLTGPAQVSLSGQVDPVTPGVAVREQEITVRSPAGAQPAAVGPDGAFHLQDLPLAPLCVEIEGDLDENLPLAALKTGWIFP